MIDKNFIFTWRIGGEAGGGQQAAGSIFAKVCARQGYYSFHYSEFPSAIRGGHVASTVSVAGHPISAIYKTIHMLIALNDETITRHIGELSKDGIVLYNSDRVTKEIIQKNRGVKQKLYPMPLKTLIKENGLTPITENIITIGISCGLLQCDEQTLYGVIDHVFSSKPQGVRDMNRKAAHIGLEFASKNFNLKNYSYHFHKDNNQVDKVILNSNSAIALGAIASGCRLYVAYPMSPSTSILHSLAEWSEKTGMLVYQPEDEIAGVHVMLGAMHAGTRSMIATSGGGFALMAEAVSLSAMTETPAVIVVSSRPAPATGLPTWTEQGDLGFIVNSGHGDFLRAVLAPSDPQEAFYFTTLAFNIAEKYQIPTFILLDKYLSDGQTSFDNFQTQCSIERGKILSKDADIKIKQYLRYAITQDGVSPRSLPGIENGVYLANSDEHDEYGFSIEGWSGDMRTAQMEKRAAKLIGILKDLPKPKLYGPKKAQLTLIGWGSTKGPVLEALHSLENVNYIHVPAVWPIDPKAMEKAVRGCKKLVAIENNYSSQFAGLVRKQTGITLEKHILKYSGRQFWPEEIIEKVKKFI